MGHRGSDFSFLGGDETWLEHYGDLLFEIDMFDFCDGMSQEALAEALELLS